MIATGGDIKYRVKRGGLSGTGEHGGNTALQSTDLGGYMITSGILQTGVEITLCFQVKELAHILRGGIFESGTLNNRDLTGFAVSGRITGLNT